MANYALINDGVVINIVVWDGQGDYFKDFDEVVEYDEDTKVSIGYTYSNGVFTPPDSES